MLSQIDVINRALARINAAPVNSLRDDSKEAQAARNEWDAARDAILREHDWGFASRRAKLALLPKQPYGRAYAYAEPADCVMVRRILPSPRAGPDQPTAFFEMGRQDGIGVIFTDVKDAIADYTARIENVGAYDPIFLEALTCRLAAMFASAVKGDSEAAGTQIQLYQFALRTAKTRNAREGDFEDEGISSFEKARWS